MCGAIEKDKTQRCPECERQMEKSFSHLCCSIDNAVNQLICRVVNPLPKNFAHK